MTPVRLYGTNMAYFAQVDSNGVVLQVISVSNDVATDPAPSESELLGKDFIANTLGLSGEWIQTSYNGNFRKQYAGVGFSYDSQADVFIAPSPYPSWILDDNYDWQAPEPYPTDGKFYSWDEETQSWVAIEMPE